MLNTFSALGGHDAQADTRQPDPKFGKLAYLTSQYPKVSHTFIRREIQALERRGWNILRLSIRGWNAELVDPDDVAELGKTAFALRAGVLPLLFAVFREALRAPRRFFAAFAMALKMMPKSDRPAVWHLIYLAEACWFVPLLRAHRIAHIHAHFGTNPAEVAMLISAVMGITYSVTVHGPEEFDRATCIYLADKVRRAAFVVAICSFGRSQLYRYIDRRDWHKVKLVRCGLDRDYAVSRERSPLNTDRLVCVGRLCEQKGQMLLVRAAAALMQEGRQFKLVLVGDGEDRREIEHFIAAQNLVQHVEITGWASAERVRSEILASRALVLPSFAEGLPIVIMEAMALGRPVLSTYVAGIPELVIDARTGWLIPAGSEDDLVAALRACLETPVSRLQAMGEAARQRIRQLHDLEDQSNALSGLFTKVVSAKGVA